MTNRRVKTAIAATMLGAAAVVMSACSSMTTDNAKSPALTAVPRTTASVPSVAPPVVASSGESPVTVSSTAWMVDYSSMENSSMEEVTTTAVRSALTFWRAHGVNASAKPVFKTAGAGLGECTGALDDVAAFCGTDHILSVNTAQLRTVMDRGGAPAVALVIAHEVGHSAQQAVRKVPESVAEPIADCLAGAYAHGNGMDARTVVNAQRVGYASIGQTDETVKERLDYFRTGYTTADTAEAMTVCLNAYA